MKLMSKGIGMSIAWGILFSGWASAQIFVDDVHGSDSNNGFSWAGPVKTLQQGIDNAVTFGRTHVICAEGVYGPAQPQEMATIILASGIQVHGGFLWNGSIDWKTPDGSFEATIIRGVPGVGDPIVAPGGLMDETTLDGFLIEGGGTGLKCNFSSGGDLIVENVTFQGNTNSGVWQEGGTLEIDRCVVRDNDSGSVGGGIRVMAGGTLKMCNTQIYRNGTTTTTGTFLGGGLYCHPNTKVTAANCLIDSNSADYGGGVLIRPYSLGDGLGVDQHEFIHSTITQNTSMGSTTGAGIHILPSGTGSNTFIKIQNSIVYGNRTGKDIKRDVPNHSPWIPLTIQNTDHGSITGIVDTAICNISTDPLFKNAAARNYRLRFSIFGGGATSLCIDSADKDLTPKDFADIDEDTDVDE